jgi:2-aminoadipate transaminase
MPRFASSVSSLRSSEIRDLMSVAAAPDIISFSGGMPGNDLFPLDSLDDIYRSLTGKILSPKYAAYDGVQASTVALKSVIN